MRSLLLLLLCCSTASAFSSASAKMGMLRAAERDDVAVEGAVVAAAPPYALQTLVPLLHAACGDLESARWLVAARRALWCASFPSPPSPRLFRSWPVTCPTPSLHARRRLLCSVGRGVRGR